MADVELVPYQGGIKSGRRYVGQNGGIWRFEDLGKPPEYLQEKTYVLVRPVQRADGKPIDPESGFHLVIPFDEWAGHVSVDGPPSRMRANFVRWVSCEDWHRRPQPLGEPCPDCGGACWSFDPLGGLDG